MDRRRIPDPDDVDWDLSGPMRRPDDEDDDEDGDDE